ncbi:unnamed protein product, partial [Amoebophrya sp. A120]|eukprot:GSA120T00019605001.1
MWVASDVRPPIGEPPRSTCRPRPGILVACGRGRVVTWPSNVIAVTMSKYLRLRRAPPDRVQVRQDLRLRVRQPIKNIERPGGGRVGPACRLKKQPALVGEIPTSR